MMGSIFQGVSGLRANQAWINTITNNIANVNTVAFKSQRMTFKDLMYQAMAGDKQPTFQLGGINAKQVGSGVTIDSLDTVFKQGNVEGTGILTDLAISGDAFFIARALDGGPNYYTRAGNFRFDADGTLVTTEGLAVQGLLADDDGIIRSGSALENLRLPFGVKIPARETTEVSFSCNLDASADADPTILDTAVNFHNAEAADDMNDIFDSDGNTLGLRDGDTISWTIGGNTGTFTYGTDFTTLTSLATALQTWVNGAGGHTGDAVTVTTNANNETVINWNDAGAVSGNDSSITSSRTLLSSAFASFNRTDGVGTVDSDKWLDYAVASDLLTELYNTSGEITDLVAGDTIYINGSDGGTPIVENTLTVAAGTTLDDLRSAVATAFSLPSSNVIVDTDGSIHITGLPGKTDHELTAVSIRADDGGTPPVNRGDFNLMMSLTEIQAATDPGTHSASIDVYDTLGTAHTLTMTWTKSVDQENTWTWEAQIENPAIVVDGNTGLVTFNPDGSIASWSYDGGATSFRFHPETGAEDPVEIIFNPGTAGKYNGITQFDSAFTTIAEKQDGYAMGQLDELSISGDGSILGIFTNGISRTLAQILVSEFKNPSGLIRQGSNLYQIGANSGDPKIGQAGSTINSVLISSALESSNVDLAKEFTDLMVAQRAFQGNARTIRAADTLLMETVSLIR